MMIQVLARTVFATAKKSIGEYRTFMESDKIFAIPFDVVLVSPQHLVDYMAEQGMDTTGILDACDKLKGDYKLIYIMV